MEDEICGQEGKNYGEKGRSDLIKRQYA